LKLSQYAVVVRSLEKVSAYWEKLGFPRMEITHGPLSDLVHRGQPGKFDQRLGWHRHGTVTWEWIEPLAGPTVYEEFLKEHGEGFHHFAFDVPDIDAAQAFFAANGAAPVQSGAWGEKGKPGSGRFAYSATDAFGGVTTEFLWNSAGDGRSREMARHPSGGATAGSLLAVLLATGASGEEKGAAGMGSWIELTNGTVVVVLSARRRVVLLKTAGARTSTQTRSGGSRLSAPDGWAPLQPWNGRIVWVGPRRVSGRSRASRPT
jgi:catechol 2,3-dioxygenase-like lactoylglutathione lyase family enzyme